MGAIETRTFKSGNSVAIRLPRTLGFDADVPVTIEKVGDHLEIRPAVDAAAEKRKVLALVEALDAVWAGVADHPDRGRREPIAFPDRAGLL